MPVAISPYHNPGRYKYKNRTAFQIALMNENYAEVERMRKLISEEEARSQFLEIFPDGEIKKYNWDIHHAKALLAAVYTAVINDYSIARDKPGVMSDATKKALHAFYEYILPAPVHEIGLVFDSNIYLEALRLYNHQKLGPFKNTSQACFWNIKVEEYIAALLGTGDLLRHAQGSHNNIFGIEFHRRGCTLSSDNSSIFAFRRSRDSIPGRDFYVADLGHAYTSWSRDRPINIIPCFEDMYKEKVKAVESLRRAILQSTSTHILNN